MRIKLIALAACYFTVAAAQAPVGEPQSEALSVLSVNTPCRMVPQLTTCGLPLYLANFQVGGFEESVAPCRYQRNHQALYASSVCPKPF